MRIVDTEALEWIGTANHRDGDYSMKTVFEGEPGADNFWLALFRVSGAYDTPRHAHNFEQVRIMIEGTFNFGDQDQVEGTIGYFCEGTPYNQAARGDSITLLLQCEGASRARYLSLSEQRAAGQAMVEAGGTFTEGLYDGPDGRGGTMKRDGALALWEWTCGSRPTIPTAKFEKPVIMHSDRFDYFEREDGIGEKHLATFGERALSIAELKVPAGKRLVHERDSHPHTLFFLKSGTGTVVGRPFSRGFAADLTPKDEFEFLADNNSELIRLSLPL